MICENKDMYIHQVYQHITPNSETCLLTKVMEPPHHTNTEPFGRIVKEWSLVKYVNTKIKPI